jgi:diadenosine tetraphosphate (Ap4A) HIT family hydrolase
MLTSEEARLIKKQLIEQINNWNTDEQGKNNAKNYLSNLNEKELEEFLIKNKLINGAVPEEKEIENVESKEENKNCVFCLINEGKIPSYKIGENETSIAVLEIKPLSRGHVIIIPKKHVSINQTPVSAFSLAKEIAKKIKRKLKPKEISISTSYLFGHEIINVVPSYGNETGEKKEAKKEELEEMKKILIQEKKEVKAKKEKIPLKKEIYKFPRRIP